MTQTAWLRLLGCNSNSFQRFMKETWPYGGSHNGVYPAAARFFESLRILERRSKSAKRVKEEAAFGRYGRTTEVMRRSVRCHMSDTPTWDELGRLQIIHNGA